MAVEFGTQRDIMNPVELADKVLQLGNDEGSGEIRPQDHRKDDSHKSAQKTRSVRRGSTLQSSNVTCRQKGVTICQLKSTTAFVQQYSANVQMLSQQMGSRLRDAVRVENVVGKNAFFDQVGAATAQLRTHATPIPRKSIHHTLAAVCLLRIMSTLI